MTLTQVWGVLLIFIVCPLLGGLPLIRWIAIAVAGQSLDQLGTGNLSVSAAFYHGGRLVGILAVCSEAFKGMAAVLLARAFFPTGSAWEVGALIALVMGRYWFAKGAGTTNVVWGFVVHDPVTAGLVCLIGGVGFTLVRERRTAKFGVLVLVTLMTALLHPDDQALMLMTATLCFLIGWIYTQTPDDLDLSAATAKDSSQAMFRFFQGRTFCSLNDVLAPHPFGEKAATLAALKRLGYPVPMGWVLLPGDDPEPLIQQLPVSAASPYIVRSSAVGEDSETASAAGQYLSLGNLTGRKALFAAIVRCFESYDQPTAAQYRRDRHLPEATMAVLVQEQIEGICSGVAFSRDPISRQGDDVVIEALPGPASQVVSGRVTPQTYRVAIADSVMASAPRWQAPSDLNWPTTGTGDLPTPVIQQVAYLARHLETHFHGIPQDIEWTFDGQQLWLLQARPVTTLLPLWTRKIASEVIPGVIHPLTWSINRPLTCGVWGDLFTLVLGNRAQDLDFTETATLHYARAYFNATLLGQIFRRMGLPPDSLEFLTRGAKLSRPPLLSTLQNGPGLWRLVQRERRLERDWRRDQQQHFAPAIAHLRQTPPDHLTPPELLSRIDFILAKLRIATYYSILAPLSAALRKALGKVADETLDQSRTPEVAALRSLQDLARSARPLLEADSPPADVDALFVHLSQSAAGQAILTELDQIIAQYGYLSEVGTDIAVPTWIEHPAPIRQLFGQFCLTPPPAPAIARRHTTVQRRFDVKGDVTEVYSRLLAELRWSLVALEHQWLATGDLQAPGDLFFLTLDEIRHWIDQGHPPFPVPVRTVMAQRQAQLDRDRQLPTVPFLIYGNDPPTAILPPTPTAVSQRLQGIGASAGQVEGSVKIVHSLQTLPAIDRTMILVVPYTDSGWAPLLAQAGGLIAETGGRLSHGAIVAREYQIPAVMDVQHATQRLRDGQRVRLDGQHGLVEILDPDT